MKSITTTIRTMLSALALVALAAACTAEMETDIEGSNNTARTITVDLGTKPAYTDNTTTRTNPETGQWEVGDKVEVTFYFVDADGNDIPRADGGTQTQTLTCIKAATTTAPVAPAKWSAAPAIIIATGDATHARATYDYSSALDPRTGTKEQITGGYDSSGALVLHPLPTTGTLALPAPTWERRTALVVVKNIPAGSKATIAYGTNSATAEWTNNTGTTADANFHIPEGDTFTLLIDGKATPYTNVTYEAGNKYILNANATTGTGDGDAQIINVDGNMSADAIATIFNTATSPNFNITGTATANVKDALKKVSGGKKINLLMPDVTTVADQAFTDCTALASISLPAATSIGKGAFFSCNALTRLELTQSAKEITVDKDAFGGFTNAANLTIVLDSSAAQANNNMGITVSGRDVTFANTDDGGIDDATFTFTAVIDPAVGSAIAAAMKPATPNK